MRLSDFPPGTYFMSLLDSFLEQFLIGRIDEGVILDEEGSFEAEFVELVKFILCGIEKIFLGIILRPSRFKLTDEVDEVHYTWFFLICSLLRSVHGY
jgi:hypothetical protein